jgi:hypothetical protein
LHFLLPASGVADEISDLAAGVIIGMDPVPFASARGPYGSMMTNKGINGNGCREGSLENEIDCGAAAKASEADQRRSSRRQRRDNRDRVDVTEGRKRRVG